MSCYYSGSSIAIHTTTAKNSVLSSISPIYSSFIWVERETSELTATVFKNLKDSRRLLTDYLQRGYDFSFYNTKSFNSITQAL